MEEQPLPFGESILLISLVSSPFLIFSFIAQAALVSVFRPGCNVITKGAALISTLVLQILFTLLALGLVGWLKTPDFDLILWLLAFVVGSILGISIPWFFLRNRGLNNPS